MRPGGGSSVMAARASPIPDALDFFPTPPWAARAGGELIRRLDPEAASCWEPAAGGGHMVHGLAQYFTSIIATDIHDYGVVQSRPPLDFLADADAGAIGADWIVTNPPFVKGEAFVRAAWPRARCGIAMLLRLVFLEGAARHKLLFIDHPLTVVAPFAERVPMVKGRWDPAASSATAYAWFIWLKPQLEFARRAGPWPIVMPIGPNTRARLTDRNDARLFGACLDDAPFFEEGAA